MEKNKKQITNNIYCLYMAWAHHLLLGEIFPKFSYNSCLFASFGGSDKPEKADYTINGFSRFTTDFIRKGIRIGKNKKISIVGHSLGGHIASEVAIENNELIEKIILIDSSGMLDGLTPLLKQYLATATEINPIVRYAKIKSF